jgi:hypothetical protein
LHKEKKITLIFFFRTRKELKYLSKISSCHSWLVETSLKYGILSTQWDYYHQYCQHKEEQKKDNPNPSINNKGLPLSPVLLKIMSGKKHH